MPMFRALRTFGNKVEGKRVRQGQLLNLTEQRARQLNSNSAGIRLVESVGAEAKGERPLVKKRAPIVRQVLTPAGNTSPERPAEPSPRAKARARAQAEAPRARKQNPEPPAPARATTSRGGRGGAPTPAASSSPVGRAPESPTSRARGNRTPRPAGSPSTNPTD